MPRTALPRLRPVTIKGQQFWQISIPQDGGGRRLRTFKDKAMARMFFAAVQKEMERLQSDAIGAEARAMVLGTAPLSRRKSG